jgi:ABC-type transporter lipoprotein component MlaA
VPRRLVWAWEEGQLRARKTDLPQGGHLAARRNEDSKWGSSFDQYKSARDAWKKDPKNADKKKQPSNKAAATNKKVY